MGLITAFLFVYFQPSEPAPEPIVITVKEPVYISEVSGQANIPKLPEREGEPLKEETSNDFKVTVPVEGRFATENVDIKVAGETVVERIGDVVRVDTMFYDADINLKYEPPPEPANKLWHVGMYLTTNFQLGGFVQKDFPLLELGRVETVAFGRVEKDSDVRIVAGLQINY